jgi:hypothetical protein
MTGRDYIKDLSALASALDDARSRVVGEIKSIKTTRALRSRAGLKVSDHAVIRYLERTGAFDADAIRAEINDLIEDGQSFAKVDGVWHAESGMVFVVDGESVVTVLSAEQSEKYLGRSLAAGGIAEAVDEKSKPTPKARKPVLCSVCQGTFLSHQQLYRHVIEAHPLTDVDLSNS